MSASKRLMAAAILLLIPCVRAGAQEAEEVVRVDASMVTVNVSVTDAVGHHLPGLKTSDFLVTDEGQPVS